MEKAAHCGGFSPFAPGVVIVLSLIVGKRILLLITFAIIIVEICCHPALRGHEVIHCRFSIKNGQADLESLSLLKGRTNSGTRQDEVTSFLRVRNKCASSSRLRHLRLQSCLLHIDLNFALFLYSEV